MNSQMYRKSHSYKSPELISSLRDRIYWIWKYFFQNVTRSGNTPEQDGRMEEIKPLVYKADETSAFTSVALCSRDKAGKPRLNV